MPFIFELWFFFYVIVPALVLTFGIGTYKAAPLEWKETSKRAALVVRSNLGSKKAKTSLVKEQMLLDPYTGDASDEKALEAWQNSFDGKELVLADKYQHRVEKSWSELNDNYMEGIQERWFWQCTCGEQDHRKTPEAAKNAARRHVKLYDGRDEKGVKDQGWLKRV